MARRVTLRRLTMMFPRSGRSAAYRSLSQRRLPGATGHREHGKLPGFHPKSDILKSQGIGSKTLEDVQHLDHEATGGVIVPRL